MIKDKEKLKQFIENNNNLDRYRKENFWAVFPEMTWLKQYE
jgi:hypothetical protein